MTAHELLTELQRRGVRLTIAGNKLRYRPRAAVEPDLLPALRERKAEIMALVAEPDSSLVAAGRPEPGTGKVEFRHSDGLLSFGDIAVGWTPASWAAELRRKAGCCAQYRPDIADYYCQWAADIERRLEGGAS